MTLMNSSTQVTRLSIHPLMHSINKHFFEIAQATENIMVGKKPDKNPCVSGTYVQEFKRGKHRQ